MTLEVEKLSKVPQIVKERIDRSLLEQKLAIKTLAATIEVLDSELENICKKCEHWKLPPKARSYYRARCEFYGECDVKQYKRKIKEETEKIV